MRFCYALPNSRSSPYTILSCLLLTAVDDGGALVVLDSTAVRASCLKSPDDIHGLLVSNLAEDDVASVEPRGNDGGDEELGAVAVKRVS